MEGQRKQRGQKRENGRRAREGENKQDWKRGPKEVAAVNEEAESGQARPKINRAAKDIAQPNSAPGHEIAGGELKAAKENRPANQDQAEHDHRHCAGYARRRRKRSAFLRIMDVGEAELEPERRDGDEKREQKKNQEPPGIEADGLGENFGEGAAANRVERIEFITR